MELHPVPGSGPTLFVAPHAYAPLEAAVPYVVDDEPTQAELAERVADWHDLGSLETLIAATAASGCPGLHQPLPRALVDLNRGWRGRSELKETLFGKGAVDQWIDDHLRPGGKEAIEVRYRAAHAEIRAAARGAATLVELHSYGDLGSTYDRLAGGRPNLRSEVSVVHGAPWATPHPFGLARFLPANLRGTPWRLEGRLGSALERHGLTLGPSPYPLLLPWTVSARFLADRWFQWLGRSGRLPEPTAAALADLAWTDEHAEHALELPGAPALAEEIGRWSFDGARLVDAFHAEDGATTLGVELRIDLRERAPALGEAVAEAVA